MRFFARIVAGGTGRRAITGNIAILCHFYEEMSRHDSTASRNVPALRHSKAFLGVFLPESADLVSFLHRNPHGTGLAGSLGAHYMRAA
jgi:hypothetical protein